LPDGEIMEGSIPNIKMKLVEDFRDDSGNLVSIDPWLREHPQVEVIG